MGPRADLDGRKISSSPGFDPRPSHYTMYTLNKSYSGQHNCSEILQERKKGNFCTHQERTTIVWSYYRKPVEYTDDIPANDGKDRVFTINVLWVGDLGLPGNVLPMVSILPTSSNRSTTYPLPSSTQPHVFIASCLTGWQPVRHCTHFEH